MAIGNGVKWTYSGRLLITGTQAIPNVLTCIDETNFNLLTFVNTPDGLFDYDPATGIFTFKRHGLVTLIGTLNIDTSAGNTEVEIVPEYDSGSGWETLNARTAELQNIGQQQTTLEGMLQEVDLGCKLRFFVRSPDASASFITNTLAGGASVPAVILHMRMYTR